MPSERVRATRGGHMPSLLWFQPPPVWSDPVDAAASLKDGDLVLTSEARDWKFELFIDAVFEETEETVDGAKMPTLLCKFSREGRRNDPTKLHFGSVEERQRWKQALEKARDEAQRS